MTYLLILVALSSKKTFFEGELLCKQMNTVPLLRLCMLR